ncbi:MAG TPA: dTMP kinase [Bacteroidetes bacterium]|nr:dTMP kinase [Bacteroidota bacterium]
MKGLLITFEGIDFCGKSVQARLLYHRLIAYFNHDPAKVLLLREPGGSEISERIRAILLDKSLHMMNAITEMLLYEAARSQLIAEVILPALQKNRIVICDRFFDSTTAYQGYGRGIPLDVIRNAHEIAVHGVIPDRTFVIDLDPQIALIRQEKTGRARDRMELEDDEFHSKVRNGFLAIAREEPHRISVIRGDGSANAISDQIWKIVQIKHLAN